MLTPYLALLRGINVGGKHRLPMADLRELATGLGWHEVRSYIQSGNLVFRAAGQPQTLEAALERALQSQCGMSIAVLVRTAEQWQALLSGNPFAAVSADQGNRVMLCLSKSPPLADAAAALQDRACDGEQVQRRDDALWIYFPNGAGKSKLSPALMDRLIGSAVTMRNWRTVLALREMLGDR